MKISLIATAIAGVGISSIACGAVVDNFERLTTNDATHTWSSQANSTIGQSTTKAATGVGSLSWLYNDTSSVNNDNNWNNEIVLRFGAQDWSQAATISFAIAGGPFDATTNGGIRFTYYNGNSKVAGNNAVGDIHVDSTGLFTTYTLKLDSNYNNTTYTRDNVTGIVFYVNGNEYPLGHYQFYIDDISVNTPVPEVSSIGLLSVAGALLLARHRQAVRL